MQKTLFLSPPTLTLRGGFLDMLEAYRLREDEKFRELWGDPGFDFDVYVSKLHSYSTGVNLPDRWVPTSTYWLTDGSQVFGTARLRHRLNEWLVNEGGHIGYDIHPLCRMRGYGTAILRLMLQEAKKLGITRVLVTCDSDNEGSRRIIGKNGGVLESVYVEPESGKSVLRFWIEN